MLDKVIKTILYKLNNDNYFTKTQLEEIKYSILAIGGDISKAIILFVVFSILGHPIVYLYALFTTILLRIFIGGNHFNTYWGCLAFSSIYFYGLILLSEYFFSLFKPFLLVLSIISSVILILLAPQISRKSGRNLIMDKFKVKLFTLFFVIVYILIYVFKKEPMYTIGPFTIILQTLQLLMMKGENYYENNKNKNFCA